LLETKNFITQCDVGSSRPAAAGSRKGGTVRPRKRYVSWVQNVEYCVNW